MNLAAPTGPAPRDDDPWRRRAYLVFLGATAGLGWPTYLVSHGAGFDGLQTSPAILTAVTLMLALLWRRPGSQRFVEIGVFAAGIAYFDVKIVEALFVVHGDHQFLHFIFWFHVLYVWAFLAFGPRWGLIASVGVWSHATALVLLAALGGELAGRGGDVATLREFLAASLPVVGGLYGFARLLERTLAARVRADALAEAALRDPLTDLPNRLLFDDRLGAAVHRAERNGERFAVAFVDLDHFKAVNDECGHAAGDALLCGVAARLEGLMRSADTVARISGDEFALLLGDVREDAAVDALGAKLLGAFEAPFDLGEAERRVGASIGFALYPDHGRDPDALLQAADHAMYEAKAEGRRGYRLYGAQTGAPSVDDALLERELRRALEQREFTLHYQPLYDRSGAVSAVEALLRWEHPQRGLLGPGAFIEVAERSPLIHALGRWVIAEACRQAVAWRRAGLPPLRVAVNVAALQLEDAGFAERVRGIVAESGLEPERLELEVTERAVVSSAAVARLRELRTIGVGIALDDFGSGHSSLARLQTLPVSGFKIDRSFVRNLDARYVPLEDGRLMLETIVSLARSLGLRVVAEGVETEEQRATLERLACDELQGFLFARPMPAEALTELLRTGRSGAARPDPDSAPARDGATPRVELSLA